MSAVFHLMEWLCFTFFFLFFLFYFLLVAERRWIENGPHSVAIQRSKKCAYRSSLIIQKLIWLAAIAWHQLRNFSKYLVSMNLIRWIWLMWKIYFSTMGTYRIDNFFLTFSKTIKKNVLNFYFFFQIDLEMLLICCQRPFFQISLRVVISTMRTIKELLKP